MHRMQMLLCPLFAKHLEAIESVAWESEKGTLGAQCQEPRDSGGLLAAHLGLHLLLCFLRRKQCCGVDPVAMLSQGRHSVHTRLICWILRHLALNGIVRLCAAGAGSLTGSLNLSVEDSSRHSRRAWRVLGGIRK